MKLEDAVARFMASSPPCILCRAPGVFGAVFIPDVPEEFIDAAPLANRQRLVLYSVCIACFEIPEATRLERIEAVVAVNRGVPVIDVGTK